MLILRRKRDENVFIFVPASKQDRMVQVLTVGVDQDSVRLGFKADDDVIIHREEVFKEIQEQEANHGN